MESIKVTARTAKGEANPGLKLQEYSRMFVTEVISPSEIEVTPELEWFEFQWNSNTMQLHYDIPANRKAVSFGFFSPPVVPCAVEIDGIWRRGMAFNERNEQNEIRVKALDLDFVGFFVENNVMRLPAEFHSCPLNRYIITVSNITPAQNATWPIDLRDSLEGWMLFRLVEVAPLTDLNPEEPKKHYSALVGFNPENKGFRDLGEALVQLDYAKPAKLETRVLPVETGTEDDDEDGYVSS